MPCYTYLLSILIIIPSQKLLECAPAIRVGKIARSALWLLAQFADTPARAEAALNMLSEIIPSLTTAEEKVNICKYLNSIYHTT